MIKRSLVMAMSFVSLVYLSNSAFAKDPAPPKPDEALQNVAAESAPASASASRDEEEEEERPAPNPRERVRTPAPPPILTTIGGASCPFRTTNPDIANIWQASKDALSPQSGANDRCKAALESMSSTMGNPTLRPPNPERITLEQQISQKMADVQNLAGNPAAAASAQEDLARLQRRLEAMDAQVDAASDFEARQQTITRLGAVFESIASVQTICRNSDEDSVNRAMRTGFTLFSAVSPMLFGPASTIAGVADVLSKFANLFSGRNITERALDFMNNADDLNNLACLYFFTQKKQCEDTSEVGSADRVAYRSVRVLFEDSRYGAIGRRMRRIYENVYGERGVDRIYDDQRVFAGQMCALMYNVPNGSRSCQSSPGEDCAYINYYKTGVAPTTPGGNPRTWPANPPTDGLPTYNRSTTRGSGSR